MTDISPPKREDAYEALRGLTFGGALIYVLGAGVGWLSNGHGAVAAFAALLATLGGALLLVGLIGFGVYLGVRASGRPG